MPTRQKCVLVKINSDLVKFNRAEPYVFGAIRFDFGAIRFRFGAIKISLNGFMSRALEVCLFTVGKNGSVV